MDGSCNGLQNLSALFRDEIGGQATNLTANVNALAVSSHSSAPGPRPRMMAMEAKMSSADAPIAVEAGKSTVEVTVSGAVQMR